MMSRRPPDRIGVSTVLLALFLLSTFPFLADAQQQHSPRQHDAYANLQRGKSTWTDDHDNDNPLNHKIRKADKHHHNNNHAAFSTTDVRALATFAPSGRLNNNGDVRASPAQSAGTTSGLSSRQPTRSLQDWEVEDIVLLATVDGVVYAKERKTGKHIWSFNMERPMIETVYHQKNLSRLGDDAQSAVRDFYWIVEPSQDGALYGYSPGSPFGMQKLGLTVKQLVEDLSPFAAEDPPVVYTGEKRNTLYTVNVQTGAITNTFSPFGSTIIQEDICLQEDDLESFDVPVCSARGTFILGRNDYTVGIQSSTTGEQICTIKYTEWVPNNRDKDLHGQYARTKDDRYIYSLFDGRIVALDHLDGTSFSEKKPRYQQKLESPVVRVFDVARPSESSTVDAPLVILPQPVGPIASEGQFPGDEGRVFVNCTAAGSWYALSETKYPLVTDGAFPARVTTEEWIYNLPRMGATMDEQLKKALVGVHALSFAESSLPPQIPLIGPPEDVPGIPDRPTWGDDPYRQNDLVIPGSSAWWPSNFQMTMSGVFGLLLLTIFYLAFTNRGFARRKLEKYIPVPVDFTPETSLEIKPQVEVNSDIISNEEETTKIKAYSETAMAPGLSVSDPGIDTGLNDLPAAVPEVTKTVRFEEEERENMPPVAVQELKEPAPPEGQQSGIEEAAPKIEVPVIVEPTSEVASNLISPVQAPVDGEVDTVQQTDSNIQHELTPELSPETPTSPLTVAQSPPSKPTTPEPGTPKSKKKAHRGKRGGKKLNQPKDSIDETIDEVEVVGEGVTKVGDIVAVTPQVVYETDGRTNLNGLVFNENGSPIGSGSGGTLVYEGEWEGRPVAVKRMQHVHFELAQQEIEILGHSEEHPNVIRYKCTRQNKDFLYIGLELCQGSLFDLWANGPGQAPLPDPRYAQLASEISVTPIKALKQLAEGMKYLHSFRIVHRDIKPQNILIAYQKNFSTSTYPRLVISDFGLCKVLPNDTSTLLGATVAAAGTHGWKAPELISQPVANGSQNSASHSSLNGMDGQGSALAVRRACDIFSLGCVFFYVLTGGQHPFEDPEGWPGLRERNIKLNRSSFEPIEMYGADTIDLIRWMLSPRPEDRPTAAQVLAHPFFWNPEDRLEFLSLASDRFDQEPRDGSSDVLEALEKRAEEVIPRIANVATYSSVAQHKELPAFQPEHNFLAILDRKFTDTLGKQRKYNGAKLADLLRALRNKHHHWDDMPDDVKAKVGEVPEGYLHYWEGKFPALVVGVWRVCRELGLGQERRFWRWFGGRGGQY